MPKSKEEYTIGDALKRILCEQPTQILIYNEVGWRLSYLPYAVDTESDETAIILGEGLHNIVFLILYGDHREQLRGKSRNDAIEYFKANPSLHGATSDEAP